MKSTLLTTIFLVAMLCGCSQTEVLGDLDRNDDSHVIRFKPYAAINQTKGTSVEITQGFVNTFGDVGFGVAAFVNSSSFTGPYLGPGDGPGGTSSTGEQFVHKFIWDYNIKEHAIFWPTKGEKLSFYAIAPYQLPNAKMAKANGLTISNHTVPTDMASQQDIMFAATLNQGKPADGSALTLNFQHALTQVRFSGSVIDKYKDKLRVELKSIKIHNIHSTGDFNAKESTIASTTDDESAEDHTAAGEWTTSVPETYPIFSADPSAPMKIGRQADNTIIENQHICGVVNTDGSNPTEDNALILMPQDITPWVPRDGAAPSNSYLAIECAIAKQDPSDPTKYDYLIGTAKADKTAAATYETVYVPFHDGNTTAGETLWKPGNRVTYHLIFDGGWDGTGDPNFIPITFTATAAPWIDGGTYEVNPPTP